MFDQIFYKQENRSNNPKKIVFRVQSYIFRYQLFNMTTGTLGNLTVRDVIRDEEVFGLRQLSSKSLVSFSLLSNEKKDQRLDVTLESVKWTVKSSFTNAALKYLSKGAMSQYLSTSRPNTPVGSPRTKSKKKKNARTTSTKLKSSRSNVDVKPKMTWTFTAKSPLVVMPCETSRALILDLGEIRYENSEDCSNLRILDANMITNKGQVVISQTRCELDRRVVYRPYLHEVKEFDMPQWQLHITEDSYDILRCVWKENLSRIGVEDTSSNSSSSETLSPSDTFLSPSEKNNSSSSGKQSAISSPLQVSIASPVREVPLRLFLYCLKFKRAF